MNKCIECGTILDSDSNGTLCTECSTAAIAEGD